MQRKKPKEPHSSLPLSADLWCLPAGPQFWQTLQTQGQFQLRLPMGKVCSADYSGLLLAFQVFLLDELTARGFCQIRVCAHKQARPELSVTGQRTSGLK